jgi:hypothetical protein
MGFDPVSAALDLGGKIIDRVWQDPAKKAEAQLELLKLQQSGELASLSGQLEVNKIEAASQSVFVAGWRPFVGWVCGLGLGFQFIFRPIASFFVLIWVPKFVAPTIETGQLIELLVGLLGLAGYRTYEKVNGINAGH